MARRGSDSEGHKRESITQWRKALELSSLFFCFCPSGERKDSRQLPSPVKAETEAPPEGTVVQRRIECPSGMIVSASSCKRTVWRLRLLKKVARGRWSSITHHPWMEGKFPWPHTECPTSSTIRSQNAIINHVTCLIDHVITTSIALLLNKETPQLLCSSTASQRPLLRQRRLIQALCMSTFGKLCLIALFMTSTLLFLIK